MNSRYPAYPNPTITEAVCDIHFRLPQEKVWRPSFPGELFKHLQNEYPEMEPMLEMGLQFEFGPLGTGTKFVPATESPFQARYSPTHSSIGRGFSQCQHSLALPGMGGDAS